MEQAGPVFAVVSFYCMCSGGMLVLNKLAVHHVGAPAFVTLSQFVATAAFVAAGWMCGAISLDATRWQRLRHFVLYVLAFSAGTWANMRVLMTVNVETIIVFRSCAPLCMSVMDYVFYQRALPSRRSAVAMLLIVAGATIYVSVDRSAKKARGDASAADDLGGGGGAASDAYFWIGVWFSLLIFQLTYGKQLVTGLGLKSIWSPVLYTNALACVPTATIGFVSGDFAALRHVDWTVSAVCWLLLSCVAGVGISWAGFKCQALITATAYTVVGVMNKLLTVLINVLIWDKHAPPAGIAALCVCLGGGALYQQAPLRRPVGYNTVPGSADGDGVDGDASGGGSCSLPPASAAAGSGGAGGSKGGGEA